MARGTCDSCGAADETLSNVQRVYFADAPDGSPTDRVDDEIEAWCPACVTTYPHTPAG